MQLEQPRHSRLEQNKLIVEMETRQTSEAQRERVAQDRQAQIARVRCGTCLERGHSEEHGHADAGAGAVGAGGSEDEAKATETAVAV